MKDAFKHISFFFKKNKLNYFLCAVFLLIVSILPVFPTRILGLAIDEIRGSTITKEKLILYVLLLIIIPLLTYIFNILYHYLINLLGHNLSYELREKYITHLFTLDSNSFELYTKGDLIARATNDLQNLTLLATTFLQQVIYFSALIVASFTMMISINILLTVACTFFMPVCIFFLNKKRLQKRKYYQTHHEIYSCMTENVLESIEGIKTIRAYGKEDMDFQKTKKAIDDDVNSWKVILDFEAFFMPFFELIYAISYTLAICLGAYFVIENIISPGELVSFLLYVGMLFNPLVGLSNVLNTVNTIGISDKRVSEIMNIKSKVVDHDNSKHISKFKKIKFIDASFKYDFDDFYVLQNINLTIENGKTIGIVGKTGSGKSTLIRQLLREFNITKGKILIDGVNINKYLISDVRKLVGYVPQNHVLFRKAVDENILIGDPNANKTALEHAIIASDFKKDLEMLKEGTHTQVSELGQSLSGGQKQRLSIARALIKDPEILILDDSLSAVDAITEDNIITNLKQMRANKTNIIVSHRFASISKADVIIVLNDGKIEDIGDHQSLMAKDCWYRRQYLSQQKGDRNEKL